jgi:hypothetical protein
MSVQRGAAQRGLLGGLLALVVFASLVVAMAAHTPAQVSAATSAPAVGDQSSRFDGDGDVRGVRFGGERRGR